MRPTGIGGVLGQLLDGRADGGGFTKPVIGEDGVRVETVWSCMQCNACVEICPVGIEQAPIINQLRRRLVEDGELDPNLQSTLEVIHKSGNSFGENRRKRGRWTAELDFEVPDARKQPVDVLWFVGDYASFDPRSQRVTRSLARLFHARRRRLRDPLRRRAQLGQRRAPGRRGGPVRDARRAEHRDARGVRVRADRDQRPALAEHAAQRVPRASAASWQRDPPHDLAARADRARAPGARADGSPTASPTTTRATSAA